ncbi:ribosomal L7Ae/L30e/S12e/Gadd45 family protein [Candidatus Woesearchaeota archaeon]|nr:ribosomal L7Ae/L30e/S12e/Gadd45 family protein [Candidatus Woesearchaeota archaeon]
MADAITEIKKGIKEKKAVIGTAQAIKQLKLGRLQKVFLTSNCPGKVRQDIAHYSKLSNCKIEVLSVPNDELGVICKKQFSISVLGIKA